MRRITLTLLTLLILAATLTGVAGAAAAPVAEVDAVQALLADLTHERSAVRRQAAQALGQHTAHAARIVPALVAALQNDVPIVAAPAARSLGTLSTAAPDVVVPALLAAATQHETLFVQHAAAEALIQLDLPTLPLLVAMLPHTDPDALAQAQAPGLYSVEEVTVLEADAAGQTVAALLTPERLDFTDPTPWDVYINNHPAVLLIFHLTAWGAELQHYATLFQVDYTPGNWSYAVEPWHAALTEAFHLPDGSHLIGATGWTGGANCCLLLEVYHLDESGLHIVPMDWIEGSDLVQSALLEDVSGDGIPELLIGDERLYYAFGFSRVSSPRSLFVYQWDGARFVEASAQYPGLYGGGCHVVLYPDEWHEDAHAFEAAFSTAISFLLGCTHLGAGEEGWAQFLDLLASEPFLDAWDTHAAHTHLDPLGEILPTLQAMFGFHRAPHPELLAR